MRRKKVIAITGQIVQDAFCPTAPLHSVRTAYIRAVEKAGGAPIIVANTDNTAILDTYIRLIDGLIISGGGDINPKLYNRKKDKLTGILHMEVDDLRDKTELYLLQKCIEMKKPVLGICRGCQLINIILGGTLIQDIKTKYPDISEEHLDLSDGSKVFQRRHSLVIDKNSRLFSFIKSGQHDINSAHHQAIDTVPKTLKVSARSSGGIIEAIEHTGEQFLFGVQWHPEQLPNDKLTRSLFKAFLKAV